MSAPLADSEKNDLARSYVVKGHGLYVKERLEEAIACYNKAIELAPNYAPAYCERGIANLSLGRYDLINADFAQAMRLDPNNADIFYNKFVVCGHGLDFMTGIKALHRVLELRPDYEDAWIGLAESYNRIGDVEAARKTYEHIAKKFPTNPILKLEWAYLLPTIPFSQQQIDADRATFMSNLDRLMEENLVLASPLTQARTFPFYQAYHARNNTMLMKKLADFFYLSCPALRFVAPHCRLPRKAKQKLRIGFISEHMHKNLNQFWLSLIEGLAQREDVEVTVFSTSSLAHPVIQQITSMVHKYVLLNNAVLEMSREVIAEEEPDILIYLEIGMARISYFLAMARLAPVQCVLSGHPVTTGISTMDYYISCHGMEPENAQEHYTEELVLFDRHIVVFKRPPVPEEVKSRAELGLPTGDVRLYCCPVMLFKIHPDMDRIFAAILKRDPKALILLFDSKFKTVWASLLRKRFAVAMPPEHIQRILFIPHADKDTFFQILRNSDAILDCVHFSFGTTAYLTLGANLPFVTWPGEFLRGRCGFALYQQMGVTDLVAHTHEEYIELALRLAQDKAFYAEVAEKIRVSSDVVFNDVEIIDHFGDRMQELYARGITDATV